jgi:hypothetical protein
MSREHDNLERELQSLRPCGISSHLRERIAQCLAESDASDPDSRPVADSQGRSRDGMSSVLIRRFFRHELVGVVCGAVAAAIIAAILLGPADPAVGPQAHNSRGGSDLSPAAADADAPTLRAYQQAWAESPEALDLLLAQHASRFGGSGRLARYSVSDPNLYESIGVP